MRVDYSAFSARADRTKYIVNSFGQYISGKVLDVGCDKAVMKKLLPAIDYIGVDIAGEPDIRLNLEEMDALPFSDNAFNCVICSDVLEHLDNIHHVFGELVRVAGKYLIISLPNNWTNARRPLERGKGSFDKYGLPVVPPKDRHKWFFSLEEARQFLVGQTELFPVEIKEFRVTEKPRPFVTRAYRRLFYPAEKDYLNRYAHTLWVVLQKK
jgi:SAM-dependent methyltransferase